MSKLGALFFPFAILAVGVFCSAALWFITEPQTLPHRPVDELTNWGQGRAPGSDCEAGTTRIEVDGLFIECLRGTS